MMNFDVSFAGAQSRFNVGCADSAPNNFSVSFGAVHVIGGSGGAPYMGAYEVTPNGGIQVLGTQGKTMAENVVVNPIPSNYGMISYDGFSLTVS